MTSVLDPLARPPVQPAALLGLLHEHRVDWVLSGSAVLVLYGADLTPNDLDVVPALDPANLRRLAGLLADLQAVPACFPAWPESLSLGQCQAWTPDPPTAQQLDHLFVTRLGMVDVPPEITGSHAELRPNATEVHLAGVPVQVCAPDDVLRRMPERPRQKDLERAEQYAVVREAVRRQAPPAPTPWFERGH